MTDVGRGRHALPDDGPAGVPIGWPSVPRQPQYADRPRTRAAGRRGSGVIDRFPEETGPLVEPATWRHRPEQPQQPGAGRRSGRPELPPTNPSGPLPPRPTGAWSRMQSRRRYDDDAPTDVHPVADADDETDVHALPAHDHLAEEPRTEHLDWDADQTGGLEVIGAHVEEEHPWRRRRRRAARRDDGARPEPHDGFLDPANHSDLDHSDLDHEDLPLHDEDIPVRPYDHRRARVRRRRRRLAVVTALVVLCGVVLGIVFGGSKLIGMIHSADYVGQGTGKVDIRVHDGDTLSDIAQTLVKADVIASPRPFVKAAEANPKATGVAPGVYRMRSHMSGKAALDRLLQPEARLVSQVTLPEGLTAKETLQRLADKTGTPLAGLQAAAADPAKLSLPSYAQGKLEGFLFPATYEFEPGTTPQQMLQAMVSRTVQALDKLQVPADRRLQVLTEASIVQAESGSVPDMGKVARVVDNRLAKGMPLQLDTTVNYATGKTGLTTTPQDRANPSPYNTYLHPGLPPGPISNPGEDAIKAVLHPTAGNWLYFVVVNPDTGETRFAATPQEHEQNVALFQQWLRDHPNG